MIGMMGEERKPVFAQSGQAHCARSGTHAQRSVTFCGERKRCRAETELSANSLAEALRVPQTKRCVNEEAARETVRQLFAVRNANAAARPEAHATMHVSGKWSVDDHQYCDCSVGVHGLRMRYNR
jgi:hypothetical protein